MCDVAANATLSTQTNVTNITPKTAMPSFWGRLPSPVKPALVTA